MINVLDLGGAWRLTFTDHQRFGKPAGFLMTTFRTDRHPSRQVLRFVLCISGTPV